jgi:hypothetical protein
MTDALLQNNFGPKIMKAGKLFEFKALEVGDMTSGTAFPRMTTKLLYSVRMPITERGGCFARARPQVCEKTSLFVRVGYP